MEVLAWSDSHEASRTSRNGLAYSIMWTFKSSVICAFMARLAVIGLTYAQPFLIMALTNYVQVSEPKKKRWLRLNRCICFGILA